MERPAALHFINTTHPGDATTSSSLSQIRSHAAKEIRLRARRLRKAAPPQGKKGQTRRVGQRQRNTDGKRGDTAVRSAKITSSNGQEDVKEPTSTVASMLLSHPPQAIGLSSIVPCGGFSEKEGFLFLHCKSIPFKIVLLASKKLWIKMSITLSLSVMVAVTRIRTAPIGGLSTCS